MHLRFSVSLGPALRGEARECHRRALADHGEPDIDDFDRLLGQMVGVALIVEAVERRPDGAAVARLDLICADGNRKREFLAYVAQIEMDPALRAFLTPERESGFPCHLLHRPLQLPEIACAAAVALIFSGSAIFARMPRAAAFASSTICPPRKSSGSSRPNARFASVIVGSLPPPR